MNPISLIKKIGFLPAFYKIKRRIFINDKSVLSDISILGAYDYMQKYKYAVKRPVAEPVAISTDNLYPNKIWTMWLQGVENAPEIIQKCIASVKKQYGDEVIVLTNENISQFVDIPYFVAQKHKKGIISNTFYSDIIRFLIIEKYGGLWLDGTTFLLGKIPDYIRFADIFFYKAENKTLSSIGVIAAKPHNLLIQKAIAVMLEYWKNEKRLMSYTITTLSLEMAINSSAEMKNLWNSIPYVPVANKGLLLRKLFDKYDETHIEVMKQLSVIQQLSWKFPKKEYDKPGSFYDRLIKPTIV
ncbi:MAG: capsular polysaccharide synthesis protein [Prevotellaceae bacterium]|jgi:hypothetical protein|nr:capsular polysaccharide synthesis protein [Prevotellaceae bacterium]